MTVYVDDARNPFRRMLMSHMIADSVEELHQMATAIGMKREWFQPASFPHYDVCQTRRAEAIKRGAVSVTQRELVREIQRMRGR